MPNRDTYRVVATVRDDYEDEPHFTFEHKDYLAPGQPDEATMASVLRRAALNLAPESGDVRSEEAIYVALDGLRARLLNTHDHAPVTRALMVGLLWDVAAALNVEWYGWRP